MNQDTTKSDDQRVTESQLHEQIAHVTETLPDDVRQRILRAADDAGAMTGTILLLEILRHLKIGDDKELSEKARQAIGNKDRDG